MKYIIADWMNNVCFGSDLKDMQNFEEASEWLEEVLLLESPNLELCENQECCCKELGHECDSLEAQREEYHIEEFNPELDRIMCVGITYVLKKDYFKAET